MKAGTGLSIELVAALLKQLRPIDISLGIKVMCGSPLKPCPSAQELAQPEARLFWLAALTNYAQGQAHSGLFLDRSSRLVELLDSTEHDFPDSSLSLVDILGEGSALLQGFQQSVVAADRAEGNRTACFVYRPGSQLIYLQRWYQMEAQVGAFVRERLARAPTEFLDSFVATFEEFFPPEKLSETPWQAAASFAALRHDFAVITGGPGTGKTTTVTRLIGLLMSLPEAQRPESIRMVAPTGKAAERLRASFADGFEAMLRALPDERAVALAALSESVIHPASTIHSFLGSQGSRGFRHHAGNSVQCDVLIVDESSMIDLELFVALLAALPAQCRIVLLGDKNQLAAVGTGNVFTDLTGTTDSTSGILNRSTADFHAAFAALSGCTLPKFTDAPALCGDAVVELTKSFRFSGDSAVGQLARLLQAEKRLPHSAELAVECTPLESDWQAGLKAALSRYKAACAAGQGPAELLAVIGEIRILCAVRSGDHGVEAINRLLAAYVLGAGVNATQPQDGLPFIVRHNDKVLGLSNGDCGVFRKSESGELHAYLPAGVEGEAPRAINPFALPSWEPAFALTIHKSQGSEYDAVVVVLPQVKRRFISWELVYTAITRGKRSVALLLPQALLGHPLDRVKRRSGLRQELLQSSVV